MKKVFILAVSLTVVLLSTSWKWETGASNSGRLVEKPLVTECCYIVKVLDSLSLGCPVTVTAGQSTGPSTPFTPVRVTALSQYTYRFCVDSANGAYFTVGLSTPGCSSVNWGVYKDDGTQINTFTIPGDHNFQITDFGLCTTVFLA